MRDISWVGCIIKLSHQHHRKRQDAVHSSQQSPATETLQVAAASTMDQPCSMVTHPLCRCAVFPRPGRCSPMGRSCFSQPPASPSLAGRGSLAKPGPDLLRVSRLQQTEQAHEPRFVRRDSGVIPGVSDSTGLPRPRLTERPGGHGLCATLAAPIPSKSSCPGAAVLYFRTLPGLN